MGGGWLYNTTELTDHCWWVVTDLITKLSYWPQLMGGGWLYNKTELTDHCWWVVTVWFRWWGVPQWAWPQDAECPPSAPLSRLHTSDWWWWMSSVHEGKQPPPDEQGMGEGLRWIQKNLGNKLLLKTMTLQLAWADIWTHLGNKSTS